MVSSLARAALTLLCAVALVFGTALFPAAFDVELRTAPGATPGGTDPGGGLFDDEAGPRDGQPTTPERLAATETPVATATPAAGGGGGGDDGGSGASPGGLEVAALFAVIGLLVLGVVALRDAGPGAPTHWSLPSWLPGWSALPIPEGSWLQRIPQLTTLLVVSAGSGLARVVGDLGAVARALGAGLASAAGPTRSVLSNLFLAGPRALAAIMVAPFRALAGLGGLLGGLSLVPGGTGVADRLRSEPTTADARARSGSGSADSDEDGIDSVVEAWRAMTEMVRVRNPEATTPGEYARAAVAAGLPEEPVDRLTTLFREVRYGDRPQSEDRRSLARRAFAALRGGEKR